MQQFKKYNIYIDGKCIIGDGNYSYEHGDQNIIYTKDEKLLWYDKIIYKVMFGISIKELSQVK